MWQDDDEPRLGPHITYQDVDYENNRFDFDDEPPRQNERNFRLEYDEPETVKNSPMQTRFNFEEMSYSDQKRW